MNEIPLTRDELRCGLAADLEQRGVQLTPPPFWEQNHEYINKPSMRLADLWLFENRKYVRLLVNMVRETFVDMNFQPAVTEKRASKAQRRLADAYEADTMGVRALLEQSAPYLHLLITCITTAEVGVQWAVQRPPNSVKLDGPKPPPMTATQLHHAAKAIVLLEGVLTKQPVPQIVSA